MYARAVLDDLVLCSLKLLDFVMRVALVATNASLLLVSEHSCYTSLYCFYSKVCETALLLFGLPLGTMRTTHGGALRTSFQDLLLPGMQVMEGKSDSHSTVIIEIGPALQGSDCFAERTNNIVGIHDAKQVSGTSKAKGW